MIEEPKKSTIQGSATILIIDDDPGTCQTLNHILKGKGYLPACVNNGKDAIKAVQDGFVNLALIDLKLPDMPGLDVLEKIKELSPDTEAVIITGHASVDTAVQAMHDAFSYVTKPIDMDHLLSIIARALEKQTLRTERKQAQDALRESEEKLAGILGSVTDHMSMIDKKYNILWANNIAKSLFGSDLVGKKCYAAYHGHSKVCELCAVENCFKDGKTHHHEIEATAADGSQMTFWCTTSVAARYEDGRPKTVLEISRDITERKKLEAQFFKAQKMEAIGTLAGGIAHDFNNILTVILGDAQLISMDIDPANPHYELAKEIENRVKAGANLTKQLLGFARSGKYEIKPINLNEVVRESSTTFGRAKKEITLHRKLQKNLSPIEADRGQIEQVLMNLYVNAAYAMPSGGDLYLKTRVIANEDTQGKHFSIEPANHVLLSVTDTGVGMDKETLERIFDPFFTTRKMGRGTGLGLASVYGIIKAHKGYIKVESEQDRGTTFKIYFPVSEKEVAKPAKIADQVLKGTETILLVDDEAPVLKTGAKILNTLGYTVLKAKSGHEAVNIYKTNQKKIDMVILDMIMPDIGGGKVYDLMKQINPDIKVLLCSGYSIDGRSTEILEHGCNGFIQKPFDVKNLSGIIREILEE